MRGIDRTHTKNTVPTPLMTPMIATRALSIALVPCLAAAAASAQAQGGGALPFDLVETTVDTQSPDFPGIDFQRVPVSLYAAEAGGMATVDFDNDDDIDILFTNTEGFPNHLYVNQGDGTFLEEAALHGIQETAQRRGSCGFFDMENDGDFDLLTVGYPSAFIPIFDYFTLFRNDGAPDYGFTDVTASAGGFVFAPTVDDNLLGEPGGLTFGDYDNDGDLDFFVAWWNRSLDFVHDQFRMYENVPNPTPEAPGQLDYSERVFLDVTIEAGLNNNPVGWNHTPTLIDIDRDGDLDLHMAIDLGPDILLINNGDKTFGPFDIATGIGMNGSPAEDRNEMGTTWEDFDGDLDVDMYTTNAYEEDRLYRNLSSLGQSGTGLDFVDVGVLTGTSICNFGWGTRFCDIDHDKDLDLLAVCGHTVPYRNWFWENQLPATVPGTGIPLLANRATDLPNFHKDGPDMDVARGLSAFDADGDGDLDLIVSRYGSGPFVTAGPNPRAAFYENTLSSANNWLRVELIEKGNSRNTVGAQVFLQSGGKIMRRQVVTGTSYQTQEPYQLHFGLGEDTVDWICVRWFSGENTSYTTGPSNTLVTLRNGTNDTLGDVNGDGVIDATDVANLKLAKARPRAFDTVFDGWPWEINGDLNGDGKLDDLDVAILEGMVP